MDYIAACIDTSLCIARRRGFSVHLQPTDEEGYQAQRRTRTARLSYGNMLDWYIHDLVYILNILEVNTGTILRVEHRCRASSVIVLDYGGP